MWITCTLFQMEMDSQAQIEKKSQAAKSGLVKKKNSCVRVHARRTCKKDNKKGGLKRRDLQEGPLLTTILTNCYSYHKCMHMILSPSHSRCPSPPCQPPLPTRAAQYQFYPSTKPSWELYLHPERGGKAGRSRRVIEVQGLQKKRRPMKRDEKNRQINANKTKIFFSRPLSSNFSSLFDSFNEEEVT